MLGILYFCFAINKKTMLLYPYQLNLSKYEDEDEKI